MKSNPYYIVKKPILSEESTLQANVHNKYVFRVDPRANKNQIRDAIEQMFSVHVTSVNTMNYEGKLSGRRGRSLPGRRPDWKKAIVTLREGDSIDLI